MEEKKLIVIDAGHGGRDPGAVADNDPGPKVDLVEEEDINLAVALAAQRALVTAGFDVALTRSDDTHPSNIQRVHLSNRLGAVAYVAVHCNASLNPAAHGWEVLYGNGCRGGQALAEQLAKALEIELPISARPRAVLSEAEVGRGTNWRLRVLHETLCGAALIEAGFLTNPADRAFLITGAGQRRIAEAIAEGVALYLAAQEEK